MWWVKLIVVLLLLAAVFSLGRALMALVRGEQGEGKSKTMKALAWRVAFSAGVFLFILLSMLMGWITPHDVNPNLLHGKPIQQQPANPGSELSE